MYMAAKFDGTEQTPTVDVNHVNSEDRATAEALPYSQRDCTFLVCILGHESDLVAEYART